jgi:hypothetical protein
LSDNTQFWANFNKVIVFEAKLRHVQDVDFLYLSDIFVAGWLVIQPASPPLIAAPLIA